MIRVSWVWLIPKWKWHENRSLWTVEVIDLLASNVNVLTFRDFQRDFQPPVSTPRTRTSVWATVGKFPKLRRQTSQKRGFYIHHAPVTTCLVQDGANELSYALICCKTWFCSLVEHCQWSPVSTLSNRPGLGSVGDRFCTSVFAPAKHEEPCTRKLEQREWCQLQSRNSANLSHFPGVQGYAEMKHYSLFHPLEQAWRTLSDALEQLRVDWLASLAVGVDPSSAPTWESETYDDHMHTFDLTKSHIIFMYTYIYIYI